MEGEHLYPNIVYFTLVKELPGAKIGDIVIINDADGREELYINSEDNCGTGISLRIDYAIKYPEWFKAVTTEEHAVLAKEKTIQYLMQKGKTRKEAEIFESTYGSIHG